MATKNKLKYGSNQFLRATKGSHDKAVKLLTRHVAILEQYVIDFPSDTDYAFLLARTLPLATDATTRFYTVYSVESTQKSKSTIVNLGLKGIKGKAGKARDWYNRTAAIYAITDPARMEEVWNNGLKPFRGKKDNIISALKTLSDNIGSDVNVLMIAIKAEVVTEYGIMVPDRNSQLSSFTASSNSMKALTASCKAGMVMEYRNSGRLMDKFPDNVDNIQESFHDMELLPSKQQTDFNPNLTSHESLNLATRTMVFNSKLYAKAIGGDVWIYLASTPGGTDSTPVKILDGHSLDFAASAFAISDYGTHRYITVVNQDGVVVNFLLKLK